MSITVERASQYFRTRTAGASWNEYSTEQKELAIAQARRDLSKALGRPMRDDEPEYREGDRTRDEYAVYEQALFTMLRDMNPKIGSGIVPSLDQTKAQEQRITIGLARRRWSEEALSWLATRISTECIIV